MAKFYGNVGFIETIETTPGVWKAQETVFPYDGDLTRNTSMFQTSGGINDNKDINTEISIVGDAYAIQNFTNIRYVEFMGAKWKVSSVAPSLPRLILSIGGVWNGESTN
jgi:hypothetical protein